MKITSLKSKPIKYYLIAGAVLGSSANAADVNWSNTSGGTFNVGTNWIGGVVAGASDFARFGRTRSGNPQVAYTVGFSTNPSNVGVVVEDVHVIFDLNGHAHLLTSTATAITVGTTQGFTGRLTIMDGAVATTAIASNVLIGTNGMSGFLNISTGGQLLGPLLWVGSGGPGTLVIQNGGDFVGKDMLIGGLAGGNGTATVHGANSVALVDGGLAVGAISSGSLSILEGGRIESTTGILGQNALTTGTVNIDGPGSRWIVSDVLTVGHSGQGTMNITGGSVVQSDDPQSVLNTGTIGLNAGSSGTVAVNGFGSRWTGALQLTVGLRGNGTLNITHGGSVVCQYASIARNAENCSVRVSGTGANLRATGIAVGGGFNPSINGGSGLLLIEPGATVEATEVDICSNGIVDLGGGTLDVYHMDKNFDLSGQFFFRSGILNARHVLFNVVNQGGTLSQGRFLDTNITGSYTQLSGATMDFDLDPFNFSPRQFQQLFISGNATLGGLLKLRCSPSFGPDAGDIMLVVDAGSITGSFSNVANGQRVVVEMPGEDGTMIAHYGAGSQFDPSQVVLTDFFPPCAADFNTDYSLDIFDYLDFVAAFGAQSAAADFNEDGVIDFFDYLDFVDAFSVGC